MQKKIEKKTKKGGLGMSRDRIKKYFVSSVVLSALGIFSVAEVASGATLSNVNNSTFGTGNDVGQSYKIAYEIYNNNLGISTEANRGVIFIELTQNLNIGDTANLVIPNGADFQSAGPQYRYGLCDIGNDTSCDPGDIIGYVPSSGITTNNLSFTISANATAPAILKVVQWQDTNDNNQYDSNETLISGVGLYVKPGLNASCENFPIIKIGFTTSHESSPTYNFAYITPQFESVGPESDILNAELDSEQEFKQFVLNSGKYVKNSTVIHTLSLDEYLFKIINKAAGDPMWIAYTNVSPNADISFNLNSIAEEDGILNIEFDNKPCTKVNNNIWTCIVSDYPIIGEHDIYLEVDGSTSLNPTLWTINNFSMSLTTAGLNPLCINIPPQGIGIWWGGLEAIVPFVKYSDTEAAQTYIVLYNRYDKDADVYAAVMTEDSNLLINPQTKVGIIPAGGRLVLKADELLSALGVSSEKMAEGVPVKFRIMAPTAQVAINTTSGNFQTNRDPFIEGIVVSIYGTEQRSVPIKFRQFRHGAYNE